MLEPMFLIRVICAIRGNSLLQTLQSAAIASLYACCIRNLRGLRTAASCFVAIACARIIAHAVMQNMHLKPLAYSPALDPLLLSDEPPACLLKPPIVITPVHAICFGGGARNLGDSVGCARERGIWEAGGCYRPIPFSAPRLPVALFVLPRSLGSG